MSEAKKLSIAKTFFRLEPAIIRAAPGLWSFSFVISVVHGASWGVLAIAQQYFFDGVTAFAGGSATFTAMLLALALLTLTHVITQVLNGISNYLFSPMTRAVERVFTYNLHEKAARLEPILYEDTSKLDDITKAREGMSNAYWFCGVIEMLLDFYLPYFITMAAYLYSLKPALLWALAIIFVPTALAQIVRTKAFSKLADESAPVRRAFEHYESAISGREYFKETRILGAFSYLRRLYRESLALMNRLRFKATLKSTLFELGARIVTIAGYGVILWMLFSALMAGEIGVGAFAAVFANLDTLYSIMEEIVCRHIGSLAKDIGSVSNYTRFLDLPERAGSDEPVDETADICFENVSFRYPGAEKDALRGVNITVKRGETLAVVGENGAGKSTFSRLLIGMYAPTEGSVTRGGRKLCEASLPAARARLSAVFQRFRRYQLTLSENLSVARGEMRADKAVLDGACTRAGLDANDPCFPKGYDTVLSREYDEEGETGADLSGGQWQRVAIARAYCREHELILLDEPTAAIDPIEESKTYERFANLARGKTAVIVTHRLGSVKSADRIAVFKEGKIVEIGTHDELLSQGGEYARMYESQRKWYE